MNRWSLALVVTVLLVGCAELRVGKVTDEAPDQEGSRIARFSNNPVGGLPSGWDPLVIFRTKKQTEYGLVQDHGRTVLHAHADAASSGLMQHVDIDPTSQPWLSWDWKIGKSIETLTDDLQPLEDSPARIILGFDGDKDTLPFSDQILFETARVFTGHDFPYATLMYVWDSRTPVGTILASKRSSRIKMLVVANGVESAGKWSVFTRNIVEDFERAFGEKPGKLIGAGVLTDTDSTGDIVDTWYGDLHLRTEPGIRK